MLLRCINLFSPFTKYLIIKQFTYFSKRARINTKELDISKNAGKVDSVTTNYVCKVLNGFSSGNLAILTAVASALVAATFWFGR